MNCIVTAGPTYEPLDSVRRLTNFSTGKLGVELANYLAARGHVVTLFAGDSATYAGERRVADVRAFTSTASLRAGLLSLGGQAVDAVFHAAAVSDFSFGPVRERLSNGELAEVKAGKLSTRSGSLFVELVPTPKLILELRGWYPQARLVGWKFEVDGHREDVLRAARRQLTEARSNLCVANGPAYGQGFALVTSDGLRHVADARELYAELANFLRG